MKDPADVWMFVEVRPGLSEEPNPRRPTESQSAGARPKPIPVTGPASDVPGHGPGGSPYLSMRFATGIRRVADPESQFLSQVRRRAPAIARPDDPQGHPIPRADLSQSPAPTEPGRTPPVRLRAGQAGYPDSTDSGPSCQRTTPIIVIPGPRVLRIPWHTAASARAIRPGIEEAAGYPPRFRGRPKLRDREGHHRAVVSLADCAHGPGTRVGGAAIRPVLGRATTPRR